MGYVDSQRRQLNQFAPRALFFSKDEMVYYSTVILIKLFLKKSFNNHILVSNRNELYLLLYSKCPVLYPNTSCNKPRTLFHFPTVFLQLEQFAVSSSRRMSTLTRTFYITKAPLHLMLLLSQLDPLVV